MNLQANLEVLQTKSDQALTEFYLLIAAAARPKGLGEDAAASRALGEKASEASELVARLQREAEELRRKAEEFEAQAAAVTSTHNEAQRLTEEIEKARRTADENEQKIQFRRRRGSSFKSLQRGCAGPDIRGSVQAFPGNARCSRSCHKEGARGTRRVQNLLKEKDKEAAGLLEAAKMLGGATIAGLSKTYHDKADEVNKQLRMARLAFYGAMALLALSVLIALNLTDLFGLLNGKLAPMPTITAGADAGTLAVQTLASLGSRALVVLPALLLAGFAAHRHTALFRLREEYSHKEAIAVSVQGFKEQAPKFKEPIAAAVFQELLANPAASMDDSARRGRKNGFVQLADRTRSRRSHEAPSGTPRRCDVKFDWRRGLGFRDSRDRGFR